MENMGLAICLFPTVPSNVRMTEDYVAKSLIQRKSSSGMKVMVSVHPKSSMELSNIHSCSSLNRLHFRGV